MDHILPSGLDWHLSDLAKLLLDGTIMHRISAVSNTNIASQSHRYSDPAIIRLAVHETGGPRQFQHQAQRTNGRIGYHGFLLLMSDVTPVGETRGKT